MSNSLDIITLKKENITDFAAERNELLKKSKSDWVLFVDSDEVVSDKLRKEIGDSIKDTSVSGYFIDRREFMFGRELRHGEFSTGGAFGNVRLMRLARRDAGHWVRPVHELWKVKGKTSVLKNPLFHYPHPTLNQFIGNIDYFSTLHAKALRSEGKKSNILKIVIWPPGKFVYNYVFRFGFLDGMEGFIVALMMSFHSFLAWSKLYFLYS